LDPREDAVPVSVPVRDTVVAWVVVTDVALAGVVGLAEASSMRTETAFATTTKEDTVPRNLE
jgi:hypothetical protein